MLFVCSLFAVQFDFNDVRVAGSLLPSIEIVRKVLPDVADKIEQVEKRSAWAFGGSLQVSSARVVAFGYNRIIPTTRQSKKAREKLANSPTTAATNRSATSWLPAPDHDDNGVDLASVLCARRAPTTLGRWRARNETAHRGAVRSPAVGNSSSSQLYVDSARPGAWPRLLALHSFQGMDLGTHTGNPSTAHAHINPI